MGIKIDKDICNGCGKCSVSACMKVCPGNLITKNSDNKAEIKVVSECWDCASCIKQCPKKAISLYLEPQIGGRGNLLKAEKIKNGIKWTVVSPEGEETVIES